jgi:hypothetical protein
VTEHQPDPEPSKTMRDADTANGEGPMPDDPHGASKDDPDAPGLSALGVQQGDAVEPNEPG